MAGQAKTGQDRGKLPLNEVAKLAGVLPRYMAMSTWSQRSDRSAAKSKLHKSSK